MSKQSGNQFTRDEHFGSGLIQLHPFLSEFLPLQFQQNILHGFGDRKLDVFFCQRYPAVATAQLFVEAMLDLAQDALTQMFEFVWVEVTELISEF